MSPQHHASACQPRKQITRSFFPFGRAATSSAGISTQQVMSLRLSRWCCSHNALLRRASSASNNESTTTSSWRLAVARVKSSIVVGVGE